MASHGRSKNRNARRNPWLSGLLSLIIPGLGQIYCGDRNRGALIIVEATEEGLWD